MPGSRPAAPGAAVLDGFACLSFRFAVVADDADVAAALADLYASCASARLADDPCVRLELCDSGDGAAARLGGEAWWPAVDRNELLLHAMTLVDGASVDSSSDDLLLVHASASMTPSGPVLLVGPSGAGKSTLAAALAMRGWPYVGDEVLGLERSGTQLVANPKPLKLDHRSRAALFADGPARELEAGRVAGETLVAPHRLGPVIGPGPAGAPVAVVRIEFEPGARPQITPLSRPDVAEVVADQCFNFVRWGARGLDTVVALARATAGYRLRFGDADGAIEGLEEILG